ncbi:carboxylating nicotinate-nucleotide diphosphorylase [Aurantimicrobium sp. MWH-Uga1]|uniref:carboxylating nicotinate-nucleotide diphosphorylase n=1 Tax=Aurantimicrobium sp. MWH-Uga1 TaxID=2079575 RepID=UPI000DEDA8D2|nr:carboxylating nicotinate-nucleotide diphosphorylase [Aurantimicrobium sp. MWH-Uga1]AXE54174.1 Nicotinate-nucleotide pyrophosphorylase [carboxylating] [Aurantimicrobium sp. MWH-Uga1]
MLDKQTIETVVKAALLEDAPTGDITSLLVIPEDATATAVLSAREAGTFSGAEVFQAAFFLTDPRIHVELIKDDGDSFEPGDILARVSGPARGILTAERIGLNFTQRMSGIATLTAAYVDAVKGTHATILDTRKTTPTLRAFERHAVTCGGGTNHRLNLSTAFMAKDNHLAVLLAGGKDLTTELQRVKKELPEGVKFEVEVDRLDQIEPVIAGGVDIIMLDNFSLTDLKTGVAQVAGRAVVEASGGVNLDTVRAIAETGVDVISVGALTHSARALDLGLDVTIDTPEN